MQSVPAEVSDVVDSFIYAPAVHTASSNSKSGAASGSKELLNVRFDKSTNTFSLVS